MEQRGKKHSTWFYLVTMTHKQWWRKTKQKNIEKLNERKKERRKTTQIYRKFSIRIRELRSACQSLKWNLLNDNKIPIHQMTKSIFIWNSVNTQGIYLQENEHSHGFSWRIKLLKVLDTIYWIGAGAQKVSPNGPLLSQPWTIHSHIFFGKKIFF